MKSWRSCQRLLLALTLGVQAGAAWSLDNPDDAGRNLYLGEGRIAVTARIGETKVPPRSAACRNCHGRDGAGGTEGSAPPIAWPDLEQATTSRSAYDLASFARLLRSGMRPGGGSLSQLMPRYDLDDGQVAALAAYLVRLPVEQETGVTGTEVRIGVVWDGEGGVLARYAAAFETALGKCRDGRPVHNRRPVAVRLPADPVALPGAAASSVLAVAGLPPLKDAIQSELSARGVPVVSPLFPLEGDEDPTIVRSMTPSWRQMASKLFEDMEAAGVENLAVVAPAGVPDAGHGEILRWLPRSRPGMTIRRFDGQSEDVADALREMTATGNAAVLVLDPRFDIALAPAETRIYGVLGRMANRLPATRAPARPFRLMVDQSTLWRNSTLGEGDPLLTHARLTAGIVCEALADGGRKLTRTGFLAALPEIRVEDPTLDWSAFPLTGSGDVSFIDLGGEAD